MGRLLMPTNSFIEALSSYQKLWPVVISEVVPLYHLLLKSDNLRISTFPIKRKWKGFYFMLIFQWRSSTLSQSRRSTQWWGSCKIWRFRATWIGPQKASTFPTQSLHRSVSRYRKRFSAGCCRLAIFAEWKNFQNNVKLQCNKIFFLFLKIIVWLLTIDLRTTGIRLRNILQSFEMTYSDFEILGTFWDVSKEFYLLFFWNGCCRREVINVLLLVP